MRPPFLLTMQPIFSDMDLCKFCSHMTEGPLAVTIVVLFTTAYFPFIPIIITVIAN